MATRNSSRRTRLKGRIGGNRPRTHPIPRPRRTAAPSSSKPPETKPRIPPAIEIAIDDQRDSLETAISLLYCLHSALRREIEDVGTVESEAVEDASDQADLTDISAMLLVRLSSVHSALDPTELVQAKVDPEALRISQLAREMFDSDEREAS
jgi:hypothetical protein